MLGIPIQTLVSMFAIELENINETRINLLCPEMDCNITGDIALASGKIIRAVIWIEAGHGYIHFKPLQTLLPNLPKTMGPTTGS